MFNAIKDLVAKCGDDSDTTSKATSSYTMQCWLQSVASGHQSEGVVHLDGKQAGDGIPRQSNTT
jgi:hypothetical protein